MCGITALPYRSRRWKSSACRTRPLHVLFRNWLPRSDARSSPPTLRCIAKKAVFVMWRRFCLPRYAPGCKPRLRTFLDTTSS
ncbi:hypothetical protein BD626DRAFT_495852 [Schizophyllum amplum]|uniref:Uncharacterized protein n=1 Tax=Schizophyllum amplum TaxID=97359 RepID=A0A550CEG7_9AGAR|nr:hypothetical protein BD626DRAFT_495845 [Auriculariopsis ampla]TRM63199.1 hypothetical protein BD626DRAFT_495852 [Auriculariopsis ampla]